MAAKKAKGENFVSIEFLDGPRKGTDMRVCKPAPDKLRLAFPEWCTYKLNPDKRSYSYLDDKPINPEFVPLQTQSEDIIPSDSILTGPFMKNYPIQTQAAIDKATKNTAIANQ